MQISQTKEHYDWLKNNIRTNQVLKSAGRHLEVWPLIKKPQPKLNQHFCNTSKGYPSHFILPTTARAYDQLSSLTQNLDHT